MDFPSDLRYTENHEWIRPAEDGTAAIGITDFAQRELGDIVFIEFEPEESALDKDAIFGTVEAVKTVSELYMPVGGTLLEVNAELEANPELVNDDPYGKGWMIRIRMDAAEELEALMPAGAYEEMVG